MIAILLCIPLALVACDGFYLNFGYYVQYFVNSGYSGNLPRDMAIFFIVSELTLWAFSGNKNAISIILKYGLIVFSIFATLSSQFTSTSEKVTDNEKMVYEKIDNSADIKRYEDQIKTQDDRINAIFAERSEKSYYGLTDDEMIFAQSEKARYEKLLSDLKIEDKAEIHEVYIVKSIYGWISEDLPRIFTSGFNEEFIRVIFQLFSSIILASMAPVCISIIRKMNIKPVDKKRFPKIKEKLSGIKWHRKNKSINPEVQPSKPCPKPEIKDKIVKKHELSPVIPEIGQTAASNIIIMLFSKSGEIMKPSEAVKGFKNNKECVRLGLSYSLEQCKYMYNFIKKNNLKNENREKIMGVWDEYKKNN